jgi:hypothetical protein
MDDGKFVTKHIQTGISIPELDYAFEVGSNSRFQKMLTKYWKVEAVADKLRLLFGGKSIQNDKYNRLKPIFKRHFSSSDETTKDSS